MGIASCGSAARHEILLLCNSSLRIVAPKQHSVALSCGDGWVASLVSCVETCMCAMRRKNVSSATSHGGGGAAVSKLTPCGPAAWPGERWVRRCWRRHPSWHGSGGPPWTWTRSGGICEEKAERLVAVSLIAQEYIVDGSITR